MNWYEWVFSGIGVGLILELWRRTSRKKSGTETNANLTAQGAKVTASPVASGKDITQMVIHAETANFGPTASAPPTPPEPENIGSGGRGGEAKVVGRNSAAEGGAGGQGGLGPGGPGGDAQVIGDNSFARGGDGGNAGQPDGRGGRRTMSPCERLNLPTFMWKYGYGGAGANAPEYDRRLLLLTQIRAEYLQAFPDDAIFINAGIDQVPERWVNKRLGEKGETWRIEMRDGGYKLPPL